MITSNILKSSICIWMVIINIATFIVYTIDGKKPQTRMKEWIMLLLPALGGAAGACLGNYCFNTNHRHLRSQYWVVLRFYPGMLFIIESMLGLYLVFGSEAFNKTLLIAKNNIGIIGYYLVGINVITMILQYIKCTERHWLSINKNGIPLRLLAILIILGGAPGALIIKILFNYKYHTVGDWTKKFENFVYGIGIWIFSVIWSIAFAYFVFGFNAFKMLFTR